MTFCPGRRKIYFMNEEEKHAMLVVRLHILTWTMILGTAVQFLKCRESIFRLKMAQ